MVLDHFAGVEVEIEGHWFEPQQRHYVVSLSKTLDPLPITGSTQKIHCDMTEKLFTGMKNINAKKQKLFLNMVLPLLFLNYFSF